MLYDMNQPHDTEPNKVDGVTFMATMLEDHILLLRGVIATFCDSHPDPKLNRRDSIDPNVRTVLTGLVHGYSCSCRSILTLSPEVNLRIRDCWPIARCAFETGVNVCFIAAEGKVAAERAIQYAFQKQHRDTTRTSAIGSSVIQMSTNATGSQIDKSLQDALDLFTTRKGKERKQWVEESVDERIERIGVAFGETMLGSLHFAKYAIYRDASEILHGSYAGVAGFFGAGTDSENDFREHLKQQLMMLLLFLNTVTNCMLHALHHRYQYDVFVDLSDQIKNQISSSGVFDSTSEGV